ncbi:gag-pol polyprotein [Cucumis melo var. makuwa]|uniref:Gag-pol polyprotein n=1 Tax=Cucumis melo var. makuwa TaxID=1194695 RepID=A0A5D3DBQ4_CUCMM|nr:gag-pol polyprotein [Cucumis melo var. makuwa]
MCNLTKLEEASLWYKRLGHISGTSIAKTTKAEAIVGLPSLTFNLQECCLDYLAGKQVKSSHKSTNQPTTTCILELLHIDLMGPMQTESLGGKREKNIGITRIRSDHSQEFENKRFTEFCEDEGIFHEFSTSLTPQQNGVVERKNQTLQEMARVMLHAKDLPIYFWVEALNAACHIHNRVTLRLRTTFTSYELWKGRKPNSDRGIFRGYSMNSRTYRVYNQRSRTVMESINVIIDDHESEDSSLTEDNGNTSSHSNVDSMTILVEATSIDHSEACASEASVFAYQQTNEFSTQLPDTTGSSIQKLMPPTHIAKNHSSSSIIGDVHNGLDFGKTFTPIARLEAIRLLLSFACFRKFKLFQMDVKSAFLNGYLSEEVYFANLKDFVDSVHRDHVYKLRKALYGLKQALRAWCERLFTYLLQQGYRRGGANQTMFIYRQNTEFLIVQIYVDDIIFGGTSFAYVKRFVRQMKGEFEMSMVGELTFFLGFQIRQEETGIFFSQEKYTKNLILKFGIDNAEAKHTPAATHLKMTKDTTGEKVDSSVY